MAYRFPCPAAKKCGGCQLTNLSYEEQLSMKQAREIRLLGRFARVAEILPSPSPWRYRNKVQAAFGLTRSGEILSGVYQSSTHNIVRVDTCLLENETADAIIVTIRALLRPFKLTVYNEKTGKGFLRHVLVKKAMGTGEVMVVLVTGTREFKSKNDFCKALLKRHPEITTIVQNFNDKFTSLVLGKEETVLYGSGYITDELLGKKFMISPRSFYQINYEATKLLYGKALEFAALTGNERVIDAYAGVGTIGMLASDGAKEVLSVELNPDAVADAKKNAKLNGIKNMTFVCADATEFLLDLAKAGEKADVVIMDPPRAGSTVQFMKSVCTLAPSRVVYVSCNPETLARDLNYFVRNGYKVKKIQPVDMFPHTSHVETVVLLCRKAEEADRHISIEYYPEGRHMETAPLDASYRQIKEWIAEHYEGMKVHTLYIAQIKQKHGLIERENYNKSKKPDVKVPICPPDKAEAIESALRHFHMID